MRINSLHAATSVRLAVVHMDATLQTAASVLSRPGVGLVIVCSDTGAAGVLTKSDLIRHFMAAGAADAPLALLMSRPVVFCEPNDVVYDVWQMMAARKLQNLPVLDANRKPLGILDIRDAMQVILEAEQYQEQVLVDYIAGVGYR
jgi:CBS domain-containing protein